MKNFKFMGLLLVMLSFLPVTVLAKDNILVSPEEMAKDEDNLVLVGETKKYYKIVTYYDNSVYDLSSQNVLNSIYNAKSVTTEITEEEYNNANVDNSFELNGSTSVETTYKIMITHLFQNGEYYRYRNIVTWKNMPAVRDYDVIAIGFLSNVVPDKISFVVDNCNGPNECFSSGLGNLQIFKTGISSTFILPGSSKLSSLSTTFTTDVKKADSSRTITDQAAYGDYSHAIKKTGVLQSLEHEVCGGAGIVFEDSVYDNFDRMSPADVYWTGTW